MYAYCHFRPGSTVSMKIYYLSLVVQVLILLSQKVLQMNKTPSCSTLHLTRQIKYHLHIMCCITLHFSSVSFRTSLPSLNQIRFSFISLQCQAMFSKTLLLPVVTVSSSKLHINKPLFSKSQYVKYS